MPNISNFFEKKLAKRVLELRDDSKLINYVYTQNMNGKYVYNGKCIGYPLPYGTQYTNPEKRDNGVTLPQADPNGLFSTGSTQASWILMIDDDGKEDVTYLEPDTVVRQAKYPRRLCEEWSLPSDY